MIRWLRSHGCDSVDVVVILTTLFLGLLGMAVAGVLIYTVSVLP